VPPALQELVAHAGNDRDERVRLAALALGDAVEPCLRNGQPLPHLTTLEKMFALGSAEVLACLPAERLHFLAERTEEHVFEAGEALCSEGDVADWVYLLIEGQTEVVRKRNGHEVRLGIRKQGECVGEMAALGGPARRYATVRVIEGPVRALTVRGEDFRSLLGRDPTASLSVMRLILTRQHEELPAV
jgi:CRP-like cAMP-binding protein